MIRACFPHCLQREEQLIGGSEESCSVSHRRHRIPERLAATPPRTSHFRPTRHQVDPARWQRRRAGRRTGSFMHLLGRDRSCVRLGLRDAQMLGISVDDICCRSSRKLNQLEATACRKRKRIKQ